MEDLESAHIFHSRCSMLVYKNGSEVDLGNDRPFTRLHGKNIESPTLACMHYAANINGGL